MADPSPINPQLLVEELSYRPQWLSKAMITIDLPERTSSSEPDDLHPLPDDASSLGLFDQLPPEIMTLILEVLDFQSLADFARVCHRANLLVHAQPAYRDLVAFAPLALAALQRVGLIRLHSVAHLHDTLRSWRCATCVDFGAFLFLPAGKRCCWQCLLEHPSLRMISHANARRFFCFSHKEAKRLATLNVIPGVYGTNGYRMPEGRALVSAQAAVDLGVEIYGSLELLERALMRRDQYSQFIAMARFLWGGRAIPRDAGLSTLPIRYYTRNQFLLGTASVPFPSLSRRGELDHGLLCQGCRRMMAKYNSTWHLSPDDLPVREGRRLVRWRELQARSRESFLEHVKTCEGALELKSELARREPPASGNRTEID